MVKVAAWSIAPIWLLAIAASVAITLSQLPGGWTRWIPVACGVSIVVALALQVATRTPEGFVARASVAVSGVVLVFAIASLVLWVLGLP